VAELVGPQGIHPGNFPAGLLLLRSGSSAAATDQHTAADTDATTLTHGFADSSNLDPDVDPTSRCHVHPDAYDRPESADSNADLYRGGAGNPSSRLAYTVP